MMATFCTGVSDSATITCLVEHWVSCSENRRANASGVNGCVAKIRENEMDEASLLAQLLGGHSKEACDEGDLSIDISFPHTVDLSLANHVHGFIPVERPVCCLEGKEAHPRFCQSLDEPMILLDEIIEVLHLS